MKNRIQFHLSVILTFVLILSIFAVLFTLQFAVKYYEDIFCKNIPAQEIFIMLALAAVSGFKIVVPLALMVTAAITVYKKRKAQPVPVWYLIRKNWIPVLIISIACFAFRAVLAPTIDLHMRCQLFDIRQKLPEQEFSHTDISLFDEAPSTINFFGLFRALDSLDEAERNTKLALIKQSEIGAGEIPLDQFISEPHASEIGLNISDFKKYSNQVFQDTGRNKARMAILLVVIAQNHMNCERWKDRHREVISEVLFFPVEIICLMFLGIFSGFLGTGIKNRWVFSILFTIASILFYVLLAIGVEFLVNTFALSHLMGYLLNLCILILFTLLLFWRSYQTDK